MWIKRQKKIIRFLNLYLVVVGLLVCFVLGYFLGHAQQTTKQSQKKMEMLSGKCQEEQSFGKVLGKEDVKKYLTKDVDFGTFWDVWKKLQRRYVDRPIGESLLFYGAIKGMVDSVGDPYTVFFDPEIYKEFTSDFAGSFEGIGAEIGVKHGQLTIISPLSESPAQKAGLKAGDIVLEIDGKNTTGVSLDYAVKMIRGKKGSSVVLKIYRRGEVEPLDITIYRGQINVKSVTWEVQDGKIGLIKISHFNDDTVSLLDQALDEFDKAKVDSIILDLRRNPGGYLDTAVRVVSKWVHLNTVVMEKFNDGRQKKYNARGDSPLEGVKTVVLVDEGSASASEIVAGALQDYGAATLVGKKTFGKGSVQVLENLKDGSALKITVAKWLTPKGRSINDEGIEPDISVTKSIQDYENDEDPQMDKALEIIKSKK